MNTKIFKVIWLALTGTQLMYGFIIYMNAPATSPVDSPIPFWIPATIMGLVSLAIFSTRLTGGALQRLFTESPPRVAVARAFTMYIVCWAFNESITLFGFVTAFAFTHDLRSFAPFALGGLALNVIMFPQADSYAREALSRQG